MSFLSKSIALTMLLSSIVSFELVSMDGANQLIDAIRFFATKPDDVGRINSMINLGFDVQWQDNTGRTALFYALNLPDLSIAQRLIRLSPSLVDVKDNSGKTVLSTLVRRKDIQGVEFLLENGAQVERELLLVVEQAKNNRLSASKLDGGLSSWSLTRELVGIIGNESSANVLTRAINSVPSIVMNHPKHKYTMQIGKAFEENITKPLLEIKREKARAESRLARTELPKRHRDQEYNDRDLKRRKLFSESLIEISSDSDVSVSESCELSLDAEWKSETRINIDKKKSKKTYQLRSSSTI